jgi:hypothetical protein
MLLRKDGEDVVAIPQPSHSWLSGQLARSWGNDRFAIPSPFAEVCLAAEQHDLGWLSWELAPTLDASSGRPQAFMQVPPTTHVGLWRVGVRRARLYGRYPALLVSLHADTIYARFFDFAKASPQDANAVRAFLDEQHAFQEATVASIRSDGRYAADATPEAVKRNRLLIAALDWMSLELCWGVTEEKRIPEVPLADAEHVELTLRPGDRGLVVVDPWPFAAERVQVRAEGRRLRGRFADEQAMRDALETAESVLIDVSLAPA